MNRVRVLAPASFDWGKLVSSITHDPTAMSLVLANLLTLALALAQGWSIAVILWAYWIQSVAIGFFNFLRILTLGSHSTKNPKPGNAPVVATAGTKIVVALFFAIHYGFFHVVYAFFLFFISAAVFAQGAFDLSGYLSVPLAGGIFFLNHLFSFLYNKGQGKETKNIATIMFYPYARIIPMHLTLIFGMGFILAGLSQIALILFVVLKTGADVAMHSIEHSGFS